jgi:FAD/FMN-containing dehydrogenase
MPNNLSSWGLYPHLQAQHLSLPSVLKKSQALTAPCIARGLGRSYGDSALAAQVVDCRELRLFEAFDASSGALTCQAGVSLFEVLRFFVPKGWFLPVTPGTQYVTIGGAIASDVHGKNHHGVGCFSAHIDWLELLLANGDLITCSATQHRDLFLATCGGMGLTGIIVRACLRLQPIASSSIEQTTYKAADLQHALQLFEQHQHTTYSVAWIDCLASGAALGRSLLMIGEHAEHGALIPGTAPRLSVPCYAPGFLLNRFSIQAFNHLYYQRVRAAVSQQHLHYQPFFYPLDGIAHWNRLYGKGGFTQYQFVVPKSAGIEGIRAMLSRISASKKGSFLAVLKTFGAANQNFLSFPIEGYTLALDFKLEPDLFKQLNDWDALLLELGGRVYLTKDVRMSEQTFKQSYPQWTQFADVRARYGAAGVFESLQSKRLGL